MFALVAHLACSPIHFPFLFLSPAAFTSSSKCAADKKTARADCNREEQAIGEKLK